MPPVPMDFNVPIMARAIIRRVETWDVGMDPVPFVSVGIYFYLELVIPVEWYMALALR